MKYFKRELWKEIGSKTADEQWNANCNEYKKYLESIVDRQDIQELLDILRKYNGFHDYDIESMMFRRKNRAVVISLRRDEQTRIVLNFCDVEKFNLAIAELIDELECMRWGYLEVEAYDNGRIGLSVALDWENEMEIVFDHMDLHEEIIK